MTKNSDKQPQLLNYSDLHGYVTDVVALRSSYEESRRKPAETEINAACESISRIIAKRPSCLRPATPEEIAVYDTNGALEFQMQMFGRTFEMFAPEQDKELRDVIRQLAMQELQLDMPRNLEHSKGVSCRSSLASAFHSAATGRDKREGLNNSGSKTEFARGWVRNALYERQQSKALSIRNSEARAQYRQIFPFINREQIVAVDRDLGFAIPGISEQGPWKNQDERERLTYYGVSDGNNRIKALLQCTAQPGGKRTLSLARSGPGIFPDLQTAWHIAQYVTDSGIEISGNSGDTGLAQARSGKILPLAALPDDFIGEESLIVSGTQSEIEFQSLRKIYGPTGTRTTFRYCPGLRSLGSVTHCANSLHIEDCENFSDIGGLKTVGPINSDNGADLILRNCGKLHSIFGLEEVYGDIDLRGTSVTHMPRSLKKVWGYVHMDSGTFRYIGHATSLPLVPHEILKPARWSL